ncbi:MAG: GGDEF domain-containing protein [Pseudodesulfovibrio sp.]|uniref:GGDEF domain-containing protein n=1 Tax=Pseudodesulfovibrio sp. TaxID=2035812 RepID=UPI003D0CE323
MRIQSKFTLSHLIVGLLSCVLAGGVAYQLIKGEYETRSLRRGYDAFKTELAGYVLAHGSLNNALATEPFEEYVERMRTAGTLPALATDAPAYRFLGLDGKGVVVFPAGGYKIGDVLPEEVLAASEPVRTANGIEAYAVPIGDEILGRGDGGLMSVVTGSLAWGALAAVVASLLLAVGLGRGMTVRLRDLANAVRAMRRSPEELFQMEVVPGDETGDLAEAFNAMSRELAQARVDVRELSVRDPLTGLYNRRAFEEQASTFFESCKRYGQSMSVMMGDLDHFRVLNETFSHEVGDLVLEQVAKLILENSRKSDVVARYGGEEFVVLFTNTSRDKAAIACENIRRAVESFDWEQYHPGLAVTISIGLADNTDLSSTGSMLTRADQYLSAAKAGGRNRLAGAE